MALAVMKKIEIIGLRENQEQLLNLLQKQEKIQLIRLKNDECNPTSAESSTTSDLSRLDEAISCLGALGKKSGFIENLAGLKPIVFFSEMDQMIHSFQWRPVVDQLTELRSSNNELIQQKVKLEQVKHRLAPWQQLTPALEALLPSQFCDVLLGYLNNREYQPILENAEKEGILLNMDLVHQEKNDCYVSIIYLKENFELLENILKNHHFNFEHLDNLKGTVQENLLIIEDQLQKLESRIVEIQKQLTALGENTLKLKTFYDYLASTRGVQRIEGHLLKQEYTFAISGWIKAADIEDLQKKIGESGYDIALFISDPRSDEEPPVVLENRGVIKPFEFITQIYGMPKYGEIDPTPFLAPFFFLYFGFCVSDAGYGLMLVFMSWWVLRKYKLGTTGTNFWRMLIYCGISTIAVGMLTGSWFGNLFDLLGENIQVMKPLVKWKDALIILDPMKEPTKLLGVALSFGIVQTWFGNIVAAIGNIKNRRYLDILLDQVPMLVFLFGLTGFGMTFLKLIGKNSMPLFKTTALLGAFALILTQGRSEKGLGSKIFYGIYNLYNALSGYLSDIMSFSRLWALGLVTGVMAVTINLLSMQFSRIMPAVLNIVVLFLIFVVGHLISLMMNLLGAFVHPLRLQFIEFFSKFFKPGGSRFLPFKRESKYTNIKYERS